MKIGLLHAELKKDVCAQGSIEGLKDSSKAQWSGDDTWSRGYLNLPTYLTYLGTQGILPYLKSRLSTCQATHRLLRQIFRFGVCTKQDEWRF